MPDTINQYTEDDIWGFLSKIPDPEIPVISISDLGVLRKVEIDNVIKKVIITITPTYSGCPAMQAFEKDIASELRKNNILEFEIKTVHSPAWTTDWINDDALLKLKEFGIAPPVKGTQDKGILFGANTKKIQCPQCNSFNTSLKSQFGSTACKAHYTCNECLEPFDYFKCI